MSYPLVIYGAGASHDYLSSSSSNLDYQPPLLNKIFDNKFLEFMQDKEDLNDLISSISPVIENPEDNRNFEEILIDLYKDASHRPEFQKQLIELRYYLKEVFEVISIKFEFPGNNYRGLREKIRNNKQISQSLYVTFNYDTLLDKIFGKFKGFDDYVNSNEIIIKLHGSHNWGYGISHERAQMFEQETNKQWLLKNSNEISEIEKNTLLYLDYEDARIKNAELSGKILPALAIPLQGMKSYLCPEQHINILDTELKSVDKIIIVGWRGADEFLLNKIKNLHKTIPSLIITNGGEDEYDIKERFSKYNLSIDNKGIFLKGFKNSIGSDVIDNFLNS